jgi:hypothetical protein
MDLHVHPNVPCSVVDEVEIVLVGEWVHGQRFERQRLSRHGRGGVHGELLADPHRSEIFSGAVVPCDRFDHRLPLLLSVAGRFAWQMHHNLWL